VIPCTEFIPAYSELFKNLEGASGLAGLGASVDLWGEVGQDALGEFVRRELAARGVGVRDLLQDETVRTGASAALSYPTGRALITYLGSIAALQTADLPLDWMGRYDYDHLHAGSIFIQHGLQAGLRELLRTAQAAWLSTSLDCGWDPADRWQFDWRVCLLYVNYFLPNKAEALRLTGAATVEEAAAELSQSVHTLVVRQGARGARLGGWRDLAGSRVSA